MEITYEPRGDYFLFIWKGPDEVEIANLEMVCTGLHPKGCERERDVRTLHHFEQFLDALYTEKSYKVPDHYDALSFETNGDNVSIATGEAFLQCKVDEFIPALEKLIEYRKSQQ